MKAAIATVVLVLGVVSPHAGAQVFSWDPLQKIQEALPDGVPDEGKIIQARHQVREMAQDALASLYEIAPGARRAVDRAAGYAVFSTLASSCFLPAARPARGSWSTTAPAARPSCGCCRCKAA